MRWRHKITFSDFSEPFFQPTHTGSDHRPVSAAFELRLNKKVIGFRTLRDDPHQPQQHSPQRTPHSAPAALRQLTPAADYPTASVWSVTLSQVAYTAAVGAAAASSSPASSSSANAVTSSSSSSGRGERTSSGAGAASSGSGSGSGGGDGGLSSKPAPTPNGEWTLTVHFPSLLEDPFAHDRQMRLLEEAIEGGSSSMSSSAAAAAARQAALAAQQQQQQAALTPKSAPVTGAHPHHHRNGAASTLGRSLSLALPLPRWGSQTRVSDLPLPPAMGVQPSVLGAAFGQAAALTTRAHQATWAQVSGTQGTSFKVLVLPEVSRHALVKVGAERRRLRRSLGGFCSSVQPHDRFDATHHYCCR